MSVKAPGYDEIVLIRPENGQQAGRMAEIVVTYGVLNDPGAGFHDCQALRRECWGEPYPACGACWESADQVASPYRPKLVVIDKTGLASTPISPRGPGMAATTRPSGIPTAHPNGPAMTDITPNSPNPAAEQARTEEQMQAIAAALNANQLDAHIHEIRGVLDITATAHRSGGKDVEVICDEDLYVQISYWNDPSTTATEVVAVICRALRVITSSS